MSASITYVKVDSLGCPIPTAVAAMFPTSRLLGNVSGADDFASALTPAQVLAMLGLSSVLRFTGSTDCSGNPNYPAATSAGEAYVVTVAGKIGGAAGVDVSIGDVYFSLAANAGGSQAAVGSSWDVLEANIGSATALLDTIGSTRGSILYRGAAGWAILAPGTATHVLTSNGAGADPSYQAVASGGITYLPTADRDEVISTGAAVGAWTEVDLSTQNVPGTATVAWLRVRVTVAPAVGVTRDISLYCRKKGSTDAVDDTTQMAEYRIYDADEAINEVGGKWTSFIPVPLGSGGDASKFEYQVSVAGGVGTWALTAVVHAYQ